MEFQKQHTHTNKYAYHKDFVLLCFVVYFPRSHFSPILFTIWFYRQIHLTHFYWRRRRKRIDTTKWINEIRTKWMQIRGEKKETHGFLNVYHTHTFRMRKRKLCIKMPLQKGCLTGWKKYKWLLITLFCGAGSQYKVCCTMLCDINCALARTRRQTYCNQ